MIVVKGLEHPLAVSQTLSSIIERRFGSSLLPLPPSFKPRVLVAAIRFSLSRAIALFRPQKPPACSTRPPAPPPQTIPLTPTPAAPSLSPKPGRSSCPPSLPTQVTCHRSPSRPVLQESSPAILETLLRTYISCASLEAWLVELKDWMALIYFFIVLPVPQKIPEAGIHMVADVLE